MGRNLGEILSSFADGIDSLREEGPAVTTSPPGTVEVVGRPPLGPLAERAVRALERIANALEAIQADFIRP